ncbi:MAG TPA: glycosyltransferase family 4 protein [Bacteroidetes bacterium]|nr:glycosyltransferase family 4 protein [Bacteroidota bacterium]
MKILYYYPARFPITMYGGTPRVIQWLISELKKREHQIYLMALEGSELEGVELIPISEKDSPQNIINKVPEDVDIIHLFSYKTLHNFNKPLLITFDRLGVVRKFHPNTVFISKRQAELYHSKCFIYHGLPVEEYPYCEEKEDYLVFIGTSAYGKNLEGAIRVAKDAGIRLFIAGTYRFSLSPKIKSLGIIDEGQKKQLLKKARGFIFPVIWDEPFGLVNIEALACGTPIIATPFGANPEIINQDVGFICQSHQEMVEAVSRLDEISPQNCRARVEKYFNSSRMAEQYLNMYKRVLEGGRIHPDAQPYVEPNIDTTKIYHYYHGFSAPGFFYRKLGSKINSFYGRWREWQRRFEANKISTLDLTDK